MTTTVNNTAQTAQAAERERRLLDVAGMVERLCTARLGPHDGADAAQDVMEKVWRAQHRPDFDTDHDGDRSLFGYAATLARYRVLQAYRDRDRDPIPAGELAETLWTDPGLDPAERAQRAEAADEAAAQVGGLLDQLTPRQREVMLASGLGSRPTDETAAELGLWPSSVRTVEYRAMARMRELLGVPSPNPLATGVPERVRTREAAARRAVANGAAGRGPGGRGLPAEVHEAGRAAAAAGMRARDMAAQFGVSESTASRWRTDALQQAQDDPAGSNCNRWGLPAEVHEAGRAAAADMTYRQLADEFGVSDTTASRWRTDALRQAHLEPATSALSGQHDSAGRDGSLDHADCRNRPARMTADGLDPVVRARAAVDALPARAGAVASAAASGDDGAEDDMHRWADATAATSAEASAEWADAAGAA